MTIRTQDEIKALFETGDQPTQQDFEDLIDSAYLTSVGQKRPVRLVATSNITLSGLQTIDGVSQSAGDLTLVVGQSTGTQNGVYIAASGAWSRAPDFSIAGDLVEGCVIRVTDGTSYSGTEWEVTNSGTITPGTTSIVFARTPSGTLRSLSGNELSYVRVNSDATSLEYRTPGQVRTDIGAADATALDSTTEALVSFEGYVSDKLDGFHNKLINGCLRFWQRNTTFSTSSSTYAYCADRWKYAQNSGSNDITITRQTGTNMLYALRFARNAASGQTANFFMQQVLETQDIYPLRGRYLTFRVLMTKGADLSGRVSLFIYGGTGTDESSVLSFTGSTQLGAMAIEATDISSTAYREFYVTTSQPVPSTITQIGVLITKQNIGTAGSNDWYQIEQAQLEAGQAPSLFEMRPAGTELALCQRYYQKSFNLATAPAQAATTAGTWHMTQAVGASTSQAFNRIPYKVRTRVNNATVTLYNPAAANAQARNITRGTDCSSTSSGGICEDGFIVSFTTPAGSSAGDGLSIHWQADAEL